MGLRGPQPKPTLLKLIQGNPGKRPLDIAGEVAPEVRVPSTPSHLSKEARKEWKRISSELLDLGLISDLDRAALALYCQAWGRLVALEESLNADIESELLEGRDITGAMIFATEKGYEVQKVKVQMINALSEQVSRYLAAFGLSPSSRTKVRASANRGKGAGSESSKPEGWGKFQQ